MSQLILVKYPRYQMLEFYPVLLLLLRTATGDAQTGSCKDLLQGYLTGQLSSALGVYQVEALRREFKSFTDIIEKSMKKFKEEVNASMQDDGRGNKNIVYTRWGKKICPYNAKLVYSGFTGGSHYTHKGAAVDPLCLPRDPEWGTYVNGNNDGRAYVYGAEYEVYSFPGRLTSLNHQDIPCAVCLVQNRSVVEMFPARRTCYKGWTLEYQGYLMAGYRDHAAGTTYNCVDENPDTLHGGKATTHGYLLYLVEGRCGSLKCPPYVEGREIVCAVCSKK
ncbi:short-chain collagen C4-like [Saccostrea cucullata]|uniref:short-chain collagen C4-like n=1 Tax=Saccostrea cuccullata TaxID=36930 RepID=UPI002ED4F6BB